MPGLVLSGGALTGLSTIIGANRQMGGLTQSIITQEIGAVAQVMPTDQSRSIVITPSGSYDIRATTAKAVPQTDLLDLNGIGAGATLVLSMGGISQFLDMSATVLPTGDVILIDPNGVPHDLATMTVIKTSGDGYANSIPALPPGLFTFMNVSGGALTGLVIYAKHVGARNLV